jgi:predicted nucleic-acid-binding Zn-ribbon protein
MCKHCSGNDKLIEIQNYLDINHPGSKCLFTEYKNAHTVLLVRCNCGNIFTSSWHNIYQKHWCKKCWKRSLGLTESQKKGKLIEIQKWLDINNETPMLWRCNTCSYEWLATWGNISCKTTGTWCPKDGGSLKGNLEECRKILQTLLGFSLSSSTVKIHNTNYYWDGYNEHYKVAFEYNGYQHYKFPNFYHGNNIFKFLKQRKSDIVKKQYAKDENITLLIIPYTEKKHLEEYITKLLEENNLLVGNK